MPIDKRCSRFFRRQPSEWGIVEFLNYHHNKYKPHWVLNRWRKDLQMIRKSGNEEQQQRASVLLRRNEQKGNRSDRHLGCEWLSRQLDQQRNQSPGNTGVHFTATVTIGNAGFLATQSQPLATKKVHYRHSDEAIDAFEGGGAEVEESEYSGFGHQESEHQESEHQEPGHPEPGHPDSRHQESQLPEPQHEEAQSPDSGTPNIEHPLTLRPLSFYKTYHEMVPGRKWVLATGRAVEDVIFQACNAMNDETFANSLCKWFVLDTADPLLRDRFENVEWNEINSAVLRLPNYDAVLDASLQRFSDVESTAMLREVLEKESYLPENTVYDPEIHYNSLWANSVIGRLLMLYEAPDRPLSGSHVGDWYRSFLWYSVLDDCLLNLSDLTVERAPTASIATSLRINRHWDNPPITEKPGARLSGIIRQIGQDPMEYGAIGVVQTLTANMWPTPASGTAWIIIRALRDMLHRLHEKMQGRAEVTRRVQVVGIGLAGMRLQYVRLGYPGVGYVCPLRRQRMVELPRDVTGGLRAVRAVLLYVAQLKAVIRESVEVIRTRRDGLTDAERYAELLGELPAGTANCGWAPDSD